MPPLLEVEDLVVRYGQVTAVFGVSFHLEMGECAAIVGANGAGKTSILRAVMGLVPPAGGRVRLEGEDITESPAWSRVTRGVGYAPEGRRVFADLSVEKNLLVGAYRVREAARIQELLGRVYALFPRLAERRRQNAGALSGGEQQMLAIGRALMADPKLLIIDEISMGLAPVVVNQAFDLISRLHREEGLAVLMVEQNARKALQVADRAYLLESGQFILAGRAGELGRHPDFLSAYFGRSFRKEVD